jgi:uncharacterized protein
VQHALLALVAWFSVAFGVAAAEVMPPKPARWFNDYAGVVPAGTVRELDAKLEQFERDTSNQVVVAVWQEMQTDSSIQDYTFRIFQQWKLGQRDKNNGIGLFVYIKARKMFMQVGYGLEGAVPDATAKRIIDDEIAPHFKAGDYGAGLTAGVNAILAAAKGEYKGTGRTAGEGKGVGDVPWIVWVILAIVALNILGGIVHVMRRGLEISGSGWRWLNVLDTILTIFRSSGGGGFSSGGSGGWSSGGGGFSGGGGRSGGGGAGGSW